MKWYDTTLKHLVESRPGDWLALADLSVAGEVSVVDAEVSGISAAADKVLRVGGPDPYIGHLEFQSGFDARLDDRALLYHVLVRWRHRLPVRTVVLLLHPRTLGPGATGRVRDGDPVGEHLDFAYRTIRVWELPVERVLTGGIATVPLAPVTAVGDEALPRVVEEMSRRFTAELSPQDADVAWTATYYLGGLRHQPRFMKDLLKGVWHMEESTTYRDTIEQGMARGMAQGVARGRVEEARSLLFALGEERFGSPPASVRERIEGISDIPALEKIARRILTATDWQELFAESH